MRVYSSARAMLELVLRALGFFGFEFQALWLINSRLSVYGQGLFWVLPVFLETVFGQYELTESSPKG